MAMFDINSANTEGLGLYFKRSSLYRELLRLPKPKARFSNDWIDEHGKDYDSQSPTLYESIKYSIGCYLVAESIGDLMEKRSALLAIISLPEGFTLFSNTLGRGYKLRYLDSPSFRNMVPLFTSGRMYCEFTLELENNFDPTDTEFLLTDSVDYVLTEQDEYVIAPILTQNF